MSDNPTNRGEKKPAEKDSETVSKPKTWVVDKLGLIIGKMEEDVASIDDVGKREVSKANLEVLDVILNAYTEDELLNEDTADKVIERIMEALEPFQPSYTEHINSYVDEVRNGIKESAVKKAKETDKWTIKGLKKAGSEEAYERAFANSDVADFIKGKTITTLNPIFKLANGETTNELSMDRFRSTDPDYGYGHEGRYLLRAIIGDLVSSGSKDERMLGIQFAKSLRLQGIQYVGVSEDRLAADAAFIITQDRAADVYASGGDKPNGYTGNGISRRKVMANVDNIKDEEIRKEIFGGEKKEDKQKDIGLCDENGKIKEWAGNYSELGEFGRARLDSIVEWLRTIKSGKGKAAIAGLEGKDKRHMVSALKIYSRMRKMRPADRAPVLAMFGIEEDDIPTIDHDIVLMSRHFSSEINTGGLRDAVEGQALGLLIDEIASEFGDKPPHLEKERAEWTTNREEMRKRAYEDDVSE
jgi:hypothetical protein